MGWQNLILGQDAVDGCAETTGLELRSNITEDVVCGEVGANTITHRPASDIGTECEDFSCEVRSWDNVLLLTKGVRALCNDEVTVLCAHGQQWNRCRYEPRGRTCNDTA